MEWTNLMPQTEFYSFWYVAINGDISSEVWSNSIMILSIINRSHEWLKHGTCSDMQTENEYFSTVLKIFENGLNFGDILEKGGIQPSSTDTYKVSNC